MVQELDGKRYHETSPDYMQFVDVGGEGLTPVGYGYRSVAYITRAAHTANLTAAGKSGDAALKARQAEVDRFDAEGIMATPKNSAFNELVMEAGRLSILNDGREVKITYGENAGVELA
jgi:hypothetical protein